MFQLINSFVYKRPNTKKFSSIYQYDSVLEVCVYVCMWDKKYLSRYHFDLQMPAASEME